MYIGQTTRSIEERWNDHIRAAKNPKHNHLLRAIKKHGVDNFDQEILEQRGYRDQDELDDREKFWIAHFDTCHGDGYNADEGGKGGKPSQATREKMSAAAKQRPPIFPMGTKFSEAHCKAISAAKKGKTRKPHTPETRAKMREVQQKRWSSLSKEQREEIFDKSRQVQKGRKRGPHTKEHSEKIATALRGQTLSDERKRRISEGVRRYWREKKNAARPSD